MIFNWVLHMSFTEKDIFWVPQNTVTIKKEISLLKWILFCQEMRNCIHSDEMHKKFFDI